MPGPANHHSALDRIMRKEDVTANSAKTVTESERDALSLYLCVSRRAFAYRM